jgi:hypothetical protein
MDNTVQELLAASSRASLRLREVTEAMRVQVQRGRPEPNAREFNTMQRLVNLAAEAADRLDAARYAVESAHIRAEHARALQADGSRPAVTPTPTPPC